MVLMKICFQENFVFLPIFSNEFDVFSPSLWDVSIFEVLVFSITKYQYNSIYNDN